MPAVTYRELAKIHGDDYARYHHSEYIRLGVRPVTEFNYDAVAYEYNYIPVYRGSYENCTDEYRMNRMGYE